MREIRLSGSEGGGTGNSTGPPYPYPTTMDVTVGAGHARDSIGKGQDFESHPPIVFDRSHDPVAYRCAARTTVRPMRLVGPSVWWQWPGGKMVRTAHPAANHLFLDELIVVRLPAGRKTGTDVFWVHRFL